MKGGLQVLITDHPACCVVKLIGEARFELEETEHELDRVIEQRPAVVVIDATGLTFMASIGMRLLVKFQRAITANAGKVKLAGLRPPIELALRRAHLLDLFDIQPDPHAAMG